MAGAELNRPTHSKHPYIPYYIIHSNFCKGVTLRANPHFCFSQKRI